MPHSAFDLYQWMDEDLRAAFARQAFRRRYSAGQLIYAQGDRGDELFRLIEGSARILVRGRSGREVVFILLEPGDCFGDSSLIDGGPRPQTVEAASDVEVAILSRPVCESLRAAHRGFDHALLRLLSRQMRVLSARFTDSSIGDLSARIAGRIVEAARACEEQEAGAPLSSRLSQAEIAAMVGASRQSVNKALQRLQAEGHIVLEYGHILVRDYDALKAIANEGLGGLRTLSPI